MNPFAWLRRKAAEAVVGGVADGLAAVTPDGEEVPTSVDELRQLLARTVPMKSLVAAKEEEDEQPAKKGSKKQ